MNLYDRQIKAFAKEIFGESYGKRVLVKGGVGRLQKQVIPPEQFLQTLGKIKDSDESMYLYLYLLYTTGCRSNALRKIKFSDFRLQVSPIFADALD